MLRLKTTARAILKYTRFRKALLAVDPAEFKGAFYPRSPWGPGEGPDCPFPNEIDYCGADVGPDLGVTYL